MAEQGDDAQHAALLRRLLASTPSCCDSLLPDQQQPPPPMAAVPVEHAASLTYARFVECYMAPNLPVLIRGACSGWRAMREWVAPDGGIATTRLQQLAGGCSVAVTDTAQHHNGAGPCVSMTVMQYFQWWAQHHQQQQQQAGHQPPVELLYLKDWHFVGCCPAYGAYQVPPFFADDWLNEFYDAKQQQQQEQAQQQDQQQRQEQQQQQQQQDGSSVVTCDYRFVYCGPAGSWTPVHADVLRSYSWSANVAGRKRWWLLPPQHTALFADAHGQLPPSFAAADGPRAREGRQHLLEVVQEPGDALFVPSGWHHEVLNEAPTLSINHNWLNAHNAHWSWALLAAEHGQATRLLEDCRSTATASEFEGLVQRMLAANSGFGFAQFADLLGTIIGRRADTARQLLAALHGASPTQQQQQQQAVDAVRDVALLACALDLSRAAAVLQQVVATASDAAASNAAWRRRHAAAADDAVAAVAAESDVADELPGWVDGASAQVQTARALADQLIACSDAVPGCSGSQV